MAGGTEMTVVANAEGCWVPGHASCQVRWRVRWERVDDVTDGVYLIRVRNDDSEYLRRVLIREDGWLYLFTVGGALHGRFTRWEITSARRVVGAEKV